MGRLTRSCAQTHTLRVRSTDHRNTVSTNKQTTSIDRFYFNRFKNGKKGKQTQELSTHPRTTKKWEGNMSKSRIVSFPDSYPGWRQRTLKEDYAPLTCAAQSVCSSFGLRDDGCEVCLSQRESVHLLLSYLTTVEVCKPLSLTRALRKILIRTYSYRYLTKDKQPRQDSEAVLYEGSKGWGVRGMVSWEEVSRRSFTRD